MVVKPENKKKSLKKEPGTYDQESADLQAEEARNGNTSVVFDFSKNGRKIASLAIREGRRKDGFRM